MACRTMLGQLINCYELDPSDPRWTGNTAAGVYFNEDGQPVIVLGHDECDYIRGCWGKQYYVNVSKVSVDYNTFGALAVGCLIMSVVVAIFI